MKFSLSVITIKKGNNPQGLVAFSKFKQRHTLHMAREDRIDVI